MNIACEARGHDWAPTGLYIGGLMHVPCRRNGCEAGKVQGETFAGVRGPWRVDPAAFPAAIGDVPLDIEDDLSGGVAKIIMREAVAGYALDRIPLEPGDVVLDIGAHVGIISIYLALRCPGIRVYAFEPMLANYKRMKRNIAANHARGIVAHELAVTADGRLVTLYGNPAGNSGGASALVTPGGEAGVEVDSVTLAWIFAGYQIGHCKLLKLDCEGCEYEILPASAAQLDATEHLVAELHWNERIARGGNTMQGLADYCAQHVDPQKTKFSPTRMGE